MCVELSSSVWSVLLISRDTWHSIFGFVLESFWSQKWLICIKFWTNILSHPQTSLYMEDFDLLDLFSVCLLFIFVQEFGLCNLRFVIRACCNLWSEHVIPNVLWSARINEVVWSNGGTIKSNQSNVRRSLTCRRRWKLVLKVGLFEKVGSWSWNWLVMITGIGAVVTRKEGFW